MMENTTLTSDEAYVSDNLRKLKMSNMADAYKAQLEIPNSDPNLLTECLKEIVQSESATRFDRKFKRLKKNAHLPYEDASIDDKIFLSGRELNTGLIQNLVESNWYSEAKNILITGPTGTGKTYISNALAIAAMIREKTVQYYGTSKLLRDTANTRATGGYDEKLASLFKVQVLILDDFALSTVNSEGAEILFDLINGRYGRRSTIIVSQLPVSAWYKTISNPTLAESIMSRLTDIHLTYRIELGGIDMRQV